MRRPRGQPRGERRDTLRSGSADGHSTSIARKVPGPAARGARARSHARRARRGRLRRAAGARNQNPRRRRAARACSPSRRQREAGRNFGGRARRTLPQARTSVVIAATRRRSPEDLARENGVRRYAAVITPHNEWVTVQAYGAPRTTPNPLQTFTGRTHEQHRARSPPHRPSPPPGTIAGSGSPRSSSPLSSASCSAGSCTSVRRNRRTTAVAAPRPPPAVEAAEAAGRRRRSSWGRSGGGGGGGGGAAGSSAGGGGGGGNGGGDADEASLPSADGKPDSARRAPAEGAADRQDAEHRSPGSPAARAE